MLKLLIVLHHRFELWNAPDWFAQRLQGDFPQIEVVHFASYDGIEPHLRDAEIIVTWSLRCEQFTLAKQLRWIHSPAAAVHQFMFPELIQSDVILTNAREVHGPVVAEHVIALVLALAKQIPQAVRWQQKHTWGQEIMWHGHPRPREIAGATLGLVGLGSIGREVAKRAAGLGMRIIATRENPEKGRPDGVEQVYASTEINTLLELSDYVVLAAPTTPATTGLINAKRLAHMKPDAFLINVGRGPLVDEAALAVALRSKKIGGAALDVFGQEPLPAESPLWDLENLLLTPHTAGLTDRLWERHYALISENLRRYRAHQPLLALVDKTKGY
ncbi:D-isomer specific 2-hydroxyacid dehydrogenase, NAD-binding protein [Candidatus Sulfotelmatobacter sp. SbA7]|nr:D-isomer specific 2-hydroxyacid dehydrogenase, NAD-binding protein [Candidatus Sulfotelmatobacter sp. SbA7]